MKNRLIYALCCPFTEAVHYVGKTTKGMVRPLSHLRNSHSVKVNQWIYTLRDDFNTAPKVKVLEYVSIDDDIDAREKYWIEKEIIQNESLLLNSNLVIPLLINPYVETILKDEAENCMDVVATFVKERRKQAGLKQEEFANKSGVALTVLRKIEQGHTNLNVDGLLQILKMFGCTLNVVKKTNY